MKLQVLSLFALIASLGLPPVVGCDFDPVRTPVTGSGGAGGTGGTGGAGGSGGDGTTTGAGGFTGTGGAKAQDESPDFAKAFPQDSVPRLDITISKERWSAMLDDLNARLGPLGGGGAGGAGGTGGTGGAGGTGGTAMLDGNPLYVECDIHHEDRVWHHVGVRFRGKDDLAHPWQQGILKLPLRLDFDQFEDTYPETKNQRFYGFNVLSLFNGAADPSLLREKIGTDLFNQAGIPAPPTAFYRIFLDHGDGITYVGLYTAIPLPSDDAFLDAAFSSHKYDLYQPSGLGATWATWDTATLGKENNKGDFAAAKALFDALHADKTDAEAWRKGLDARLNVDEFLHWLALNTVIQDKGTYGLAAHNYYLYAGKYGRFEWIPWNHAHAFSAEGGVLSLGLSEVSDTWPLIRYLLDDPAFSAVYRGYLAQVAAFDYEAVAAEKRFQTAHDLIKPYVIGSAGELPGSTFVASEAAFEGALAALIAHAKQRKQDVANYLAP